MPMGDSITEWNCNSESQGGYRGYLGNSLYLAPFSFTFVGSQYGCGNHEGHSGWTVQQLQTIAPGVLATYAPDVLMIQAGTNDAFFNQNCTQSGCDGGANTTGTLARLATLISTAIKQLPNVKIAVSGITLVNATRCANYSTAPWAPPNCPLGMNQEILEINAALPALVASFGPAVSFHDPNPECQFTADDYWTWGIHFSESGYTKIASSWFKHLQPILSAIVAARQQL